MGKKKTGKKSPLKLREPGVDYGDRAPANRYEALELRCENFARAVRRFLKRMPMTLLNQDDARQLIRSSGSVAANYIEANDSLGRKDFAMHIKISRKEAKESRLWLRLLDEQEGPLEPQRLALITESTELMNIFGAIYRNLDRPK
jgi:four helix bundle protein